MKKSAIQFALYLHIHPHIGLEQWKLMRTLPSGMTQLLEVTASQKKRQDLANKSGIEETVMQEALHNFLRLVLLDHSITPYRGLAVREKASLDTCKKHKRLLRNIFHPDRFPDDSCHEVVNLVQKSYEQIENIQSSTPTQKVTPHITHKETYQTSKPDFVINHSPRYSSTYNNDDTQKQINFALVAGVMGIALLGILIMLVMPSAPQSIVRQDVVSISNQPTSEPLQKFTLASSISSPLSNGTTTLSNEAQGSRIQTLLNEFEAALEGNLIAELKASNISPQSSKQIINLFLSAKNKKVFLHSFSWKPTTDGFYGEGKFLTRFEFDDRKQWITRRGKSSITLSDKNSKLLIKQFHFEDNLH